MNFMLSSRRDASYAVNQTPEGVNAINGVYNWCGCVNPCVDDSS